MVENSLILFIYLIGIIFFLAIGALLHEAVEYWNMRKWHKRVYDKVQLPNNKR